MSGIRGAAKTALLGAGHYARRLARDRFPGVAVLCYHGIRADDERPGAWPFEDLHVRASELDAHCRFLRAHCDPIGLDQWRAAREGRAALGARPVLVTFDDGYRSLLTRGVPILARHGIPAVAFVCSDVAERGGLHWYDALARRDGEAAVERAKALSYDEWRRDVETVPAAPADPAAPLDVAGVRALAIAPGIEIGGHGASHGILARADRDRQRDEIARNKACLEAWTGRPVRAFAYPNGEPSIDYTDETVALVAEAGFDAAFTTRAGFATTADPPLELPRFLMLAGTSAAELGHRLTYSWRREATR